MNHEQDETTAVRADGTSDSDSRDYAKDDQDAADAFLRHFGMPDSKSVRERVEEEREARVKAKEDAGYAPAPTNVLWMVDGDSKPFIRLEQDLLAGDYTIEDIETFIARLTGAVMLGKRMSALRPWLEKNDVDPEMVIKLLLAAAKDTDEVASKEALLALGGVFGRNWP